MFASKCKNICIWLLFVVFFSAMTHGWIRVLFSLFIQNELGQLFPLQIVAQSVLPPSTHPLCTPWACSSTWGSSSGHPQLLHHLTGLRWKYSFFQHWKRPWWVQKWWKYHQTTRRTSRGFMEATEDMEGIMENTGNGSTEVVHFEQGFKDVSYTHLTLPTIYSV